MGPRRKSRMPARDYNAAQNLPDWLRTFAEFQQLEVPARFPYFPQRGDEIVVLRVGYEDYLRTICKLRLFNVGKRAWPSNDFEAEELARVDEVGQTDSLFACTKCHCIMCRWSGSSNLPDWQSCIYRSCTWQVGNQPGSTTISITR